MLTYIFVYLLALLNCFNQNKKARRYVSLFIMLLLCFLTSFRNDTCGVDTPTYLDIYNLSRGVEYYKYEYVFNYLIKSFYFLGLSPTICQVIMSLCCYLPLIMLFFKLSKNLELSILIFLISPNNYFLETFNIVRQLCALPYFLWAVYFYFNNRYLKALLLIVVAVGFHNSTLIYIPFVIVAKHIRITYKVAVIMHAVTILWALFVATSGFLSQFYTFISDLQIMGLAKYGYLENKIGEYDLSTVGVIVLIIPGLFLSLYALKRYPNNDFVKLYLLGCVFLNFVSYMPISYRMAYDLIAIEMFLLPFLLQQTNSKNIKRNYITKQHMLLYLYLTFIILLCIRQFMNESFQFQYVPYRTFF